jgi:hypothetical protein
MGNEREAVLAEMSDQMDEAIAIVLNSGEVNADDVLVAGVKVGLTIGYGLARAHAIKERALRDAAETATGTYTHDVRAQAFGEIADKLHRWEKEHPPSRETRSESDVPDSDPDGKPESQIIVLTLGMQLPDGTLREVARRVPGYAVALAADGHAALYKAITAMAKEFMQGDRG